MLNQTVAPFGLALFLASSPIHPDAPWARDVQRQPSPSAEIDYEPFPVILFVNTDGFTVQPCETDNAALGCSTVVTEELVIAPFDGGDLVDDVRTMLEPFDIDVVGESPPAWVPYTMVAVGPAPDTPSCTMGPTECEGRNRSSLGWVTEGCFGLGYPNLVVSRAALAWGLEPTASDAIVVVADECLELVQSEQQCPAAHRTACPQAGEQNAAAELSAMFGPRQEDSVAPTIVELLPTETTFTTIDTILVSARVSEDSRFVAARWTWDRGLAPGVDSYSKCTNDVCDADFGLDFGVDPNEASYDFVELSGPPAGIYSFTFEAQDARGNAVTETVTFEVVDPEGPGGPPLDTEGDETDADEADAGCGCRTSGGAGPWFAWLLPLLWRRRPI